MFSDVIAMTPIIVLGSTNDQVKQTMFNKFIFTALASLLLVVSTEFSFSDKDKQAKITWEPKEIKTSVFRGGTRTVVVSFISTQSIASASIFISPQIRPFIKISTTTVFNITKGENLLKLSITTSKDNKKGKLEGSLHIRSGNRTIPKLLEIEIEVLNTQNVEQKISEFLVQQFGTMMPVVPADKKFLLATTTIELESILMQGSNLPAVFKAGSVFFVSNLFSDFAVFSAVDELMPLITNTGVRTSDIESVHLSLIHGWSRDNPNEPLIPDSAPGTAVTFFSGLSPLDVNEDGKTDHYVFVPLNNTHTVLHSNDADEIIARRFTTTEGISESAATALHELVHVMDFRTECGGGQNWYTSQEEEDFVSLFVEPLIKNVFANANTNLLNSTVNSALNEFPNTQNCLERLDLTRPATVILNTPTNISSTSVTLSWSQNTDRDFSSYKIFRSTNANVGVNNTLIATITSPNQTSLADTNLSSNTQFFYKVFVFDKAGLSRGSNEVSITTASTTIPGQPGPNVGDFVLLPMLVNGIRGGSLTNLDMMGNSKAVVIGGIGEISTVAVPQGTVEHIASLNAQPYADTVSNDGNTTYVLSNPGNGIGPGQIDKIDLITKATSSVAVSNTFHSNAGGDITITPDQPSLIATFGNGGTVSVNIQSHNVQAISGYGGTGIVIEPGRQTALVSASFGSGLDQGDGLIRINLTTGQGTLVHTLPSTPTDVALSPDGQVAYVSTYTGVYQIGLQPVTIQSVSSQTCSHIDIKADGTGLICIGFDPSFPFLGSPPDLFLISLPGGSVSTINRTIFAPGDFIKETDSTLLIADTSCISFTGISRYDIATTITDRISDPICGIAGMVQEPNTPNLIIGIANGPSGSIFEFSPLTKETHVIASSFNHPGDVYLGQYGHTLFLTDGFNQPYPGSLLKGDLNSSTTITLFTGFQNPSRFAIDEQNHKAYVLEQGGNGSLEQINLDTGEEKLIASNLAGTGDIPQTIAFEDANHLLIGADGKIMRVNVLTHATTVIAQDFCALPSNGLRDIIIESGGQTALVSSSICGMVRVRIKQ